MVSEIIERVVGYGICPGSPSEGACNRVTRQVLILFLSLFCCCFRYFYFILFYFSLLSFNFHNACGLFFCYTCLFFSCGYLVGVSSDDCFIGCFIGTVLGV